MRNFQWLPPGRSAVGRAPGYQHPLGLTKDLSSFLTHPAHPRVWLRALKAATPAGSALISYVFPVQGGAAPIDGCWARQRRRRPP